MAVHILGIETSCDETSAAVVRDGRQILSSVIASQVAEHSKFGGVVPEVASRKHLEWLNPVLQEALERAGIGWLDLSGVAVTCGPGLVGALLVGLSAAKAIALALDIPLLAVNHMQAHVLANWLVEPLPELPAVCLVVSGGHTDLLLLRGLGDFELLGQTRDDAAGEAFDKVARVLGLGYPGGPPIDRLARQGDSRAVEFPRAFLEEDSLDFSFSGLKSAVLNYLHRAAQQGVEVNRADVAASFQQAVVDVLVEKTMQAVRRCGVRQVLLAGGVAANSALRSALERAAAQQGCRLACPPPVLCTDNAAMVACAGYYKYLRGDFAPLTVNAVPYLEPGQDAYQAEKLYTALR
ncbi:MAG: tRNA (adenosine(37)-N6)-threonylcarbamoyltransferase complex transferase subunit TsaD [Desulfurispora sp.]|uniref:tRNA (adenosine(37)-N6)-threonylcarbamoyltransferase complex transferase subunit TsaD n=1 Tax=Desulfurispora sp. TaxID=3014275 RepID=UPI004049E607